MRDTRATSFPPSLAPLSRGGVWPQAQRASGQPRLVAVISLIAAVMLLLAPPPLYADVSTPNEEQLSHLLLIEKACCVVDARKADERDKLPLPEAQTYAAEGFKLRRDNVDGELLIVIANDKQRAVAIAKSLDAAYPGHRVIAIGGGAAPWLDARAAAMQQLAAPPPAFSFVIPKNTCESGQTLQVLRGDAPDSPHR